MTDQVNETAASNEVVENTSDQELSQQTQERQDIFSSNQTQQESWLNSLKDADLKSSKSLSNFKDVESLAKSYVHLEKKLGSPKEEANYSKDDYTYEMPEGYEANEDLINLVKDKASELGIKPQAFKGLVEAFMSKENEIIHGMQMAQQQEEVEATTKLKQEWGNDYEKNMDVASKIWKTFTTAEDDVALQQMPPSARLEVAKVMHNIASKISENSIGNISGNYLLTKQEAQAKLESIQADREHPYHKGDAKAVSEYFELQKAALG